MEIYTIDKSYQFTNLNLYFFDLNDPEFHRMWLIFFSETKCIQLD